MYKYIYIYINKEVFISIFIKLQLFSSCFVEK